MRVRSGSYQSEDPSQVSKLTADCNNDCGVMEDQSELVTLFFMTIISPF